MAKDTTTNWDGVGGELLYVMSNSGPNRLVLSPLSSLGGIQVQSSIKACDVDHEVFVFFLQGIQGNIGAWGEVGPGGTRGDPGPRGAAGPLGVPGYPVGSF